jgi:hypothetical protein
VTITATTAACPGGVDYTVGDENRRQAEACIPGRELHEREKQDNDRGQPATTFGGGADDRRRRRSDRRRAGGRRSTAEAGGGGRRRRRITYAKKEKATRAEKIIMGRISNPTR